MSAISPTSYFPHLSRPRPPQDTKPGTKKAELVSVAAISGAVIVHLTTLILFVAILGNWIISILPEWVVATFDYIMPAIIGAVFVQLAFVLRDLFTTLVALALGTFAVFVFAANWPNLSGFALPIVVIGTVITAMLVFSRKSDQTEPESVSPM